MPDTNAPELPLTLVESTEERLQKMSVLPDVKAALTPAPGKTKLLALGPDETINKLIGDKSFVSFSFKEGESLNQQLASSLYGRGYGEIPNEKRFFILSLETCLKQHGVNASAFGVGDFVEFDFNKGTFTKHQAGEAPATEKLTLSASEELTLNARTEIVTKTQTQVNELIEKLEKEGILYEALRAYREDASFAGRVNYIKNHKDLFLNLVNYYLPADSTERLTPGGNNFNYKGTSTQNIAYLKAFLSMKRNEQLGAPLPTLTLEETEWVKPQAPEEPEALLSVPELTPSTNPANAAPEMPATPVEAAKQPDKTAEAVKESTDTRTLLDKDWSRIMANINSSAGNYPDVSIKDDVWENPWAKEGQSASKIINISCGDALYRVFIHVPLSNMPSSYADDSVRITLEAPRAVKGYKPALFYDRDQENHKEGQMIDNKSISIENIVSIIAGDLEDLQQKRDARKEARQSKTAQPLTSSVEAPKTKEENEAPSEPTDAAYRAAVAQMDLEAANAALDKEKDFEKRALLRARILELIESGKTPQ